MALTDANLCWEVRATGASTNGGAFKAGATGTDYSQQDAAQITYTDLAIDAVTNTKLTSAANPFTAAHVGNIINVTGGTGFTTGRYVVVSVTGATATMDRAVGTVGSTGGAGKLGGALDGLVTLASCYVISNKAFVRGASGTIQQSATATFALDGGPGATAPYTHIIGYNTTRGDGGFATIQLITNSSLTAINMSFGGHLFENLIVDCNSLTGSTGIGMNGLYNVVRNCVVKNFKTMGINANNSQGYGLISDCEITGGLSGASSAVTLSGAQVLASNTIHGNACTGVSGGNLCSIEDNLIYNNTGAVSHGVTFSIQARIQHNIIDGNGADGLHNTSSNLIAMSAKNNLITNNGGWGFNGSATAGNPADRMWDGNAFLSNASGNRRNMDDAGTVNAINGVVPYTNTRDVILTADPYNNRAGGDFGLNTAAGGGAAVRAAGYPRAWLNNSTVSARDMGAAQHADPASSGGGGTGQGIWISNV